MTEQNHSPGTGSSYHYIHLTPEKLKRLPPNQALQACLEFRRLLQILTGILASPDNDRILRAVAMDLIYTQALKEASGRLPEEKTPAVYDIKTVSERLGIPPAQIRRAYDKLEQLGGVHIVGRQFPRKRGRQGEAESGNATYDDHLSGMD